MSQIPLFQPISLSVTDLTRYLRVLIESDNILQDIWVQGEISNYVHHSSGHIYFTLKDSSAELRCVMWRSSAARQSYLPASGDAVEVHGSVSVYEARGQYQLYADQFRPLGEGALYQAFLRLKASLEGEGLFDQERKRPIPAWPGVIGVVTSPTGAAIRDILTTLERRYPLGQVVLAPALVQGEGAPASVVAAIENLNRFASPDVILVARGGGSLEDLVAFNAESVARAVVASEAPVISGVGHETDFTIVDFVADLRAPTPTAAAELAVPDRAELQFELSEMAANLGRAVVDVLDELRWSLDQSQSMLQMRSPKARIQNDRQRLDEMVYRARRALHSVGRWERSQLQAWEQRLGALDPRAVLGRGFASVSHLDGRIIRSLSDVHIDEQVGIRLADGAFQARVTDLGPDAAGEDS